MPSDVTIGLRNFIDWLTGTVRGITNGGAGTAADGWTVVEADDGTVREVSGDGTLAGLGGTNKWRLGTTLPVDAWCVVEGEGTYGEKIQIYATVNDNANRMAFQMIPLADWTTGGDQSPTPSFPATIIPAIHEDADEMVTTGRLFACADEGVIVLCYDGISVADQHMWCMGEVNGHDAVNDLRPFVFYNDPNNPLRGDEWHRLSPVDDTTRLGGSNDGQRMAYTSYGVIDMLTSSNPAMVAIGNRQEYEAGVRFTTPGHDHQVGTLRYVTLTHGSIGVRGTMTSEGGSADDRMVINRSSGPAILMDWDGTAYP